MDDISGVNCTAYRIYNVTYKSDWTNHTSSFSLASLGSGTYTIGYNSTDYAGNVETTHTTDVTLFSWNYVFKDSQGRGTTLKINTAYKLFQFIAPGNDYGIRRATNMVSSGVAIMIYHSDSQLSLITLAMGTRTDFCMAIASDKLTYVRYLLIGNSR